MKNLQRTLFFLILYFIGTTLFYSNPCIAQGNISIKQMLDTKWKAVYMNPCTNERELLSVGVNQWIRFHSDNRYEIQALGEDSRWGSWTYEAGSQMLSLREKESGKISQWHITRLSHRNMEIEIKKGDKCQRITYQKVLE